VQLQTVQQKAETAKLPKGTDTEDRPDVHPGYKYSSRLSRSAIFLVVGSGILLFMFILKMPFSNVRSYRSYLQWPHNPGSLPQHLDAAHLAPLQYHDR
jgi:hypothetical protein